MIRLRGMEQGIVNVIHLTFAVPRRAARTTIPYL
jgi:hypothetical protein